MKRPVFIVFDLWLIVTMICVSLCMAEETRYRSRCEPPVPDTWLQEQQRIAREKTPPNVPVMSVIDCRPQSCEVDLTEDIKVICRTCSYSIYKCSSAENDGKVVLKCRDTVVKDKPEITITREDFKNKKIRCTTFCGSCGTGWK
ncbi:MAG: hypothetical protein EG826_14025 [Deltaproteobacteria bacterium]|nr:hypothetical protein [Deltaproteobacteria bacterium]